MVNKEEIFKPIIGYNTSYEVSNMGRVRSLPKKANNYKFKMLSLWENSKKKPYLRVRLLGKSFLVHRLVAENFISNNDKKQQVNHKDGDKRNNKVDNLEWVTNSENQQHAIRTGLKNILKGDNTFNTKLTNNQVVEILNSNMPSIDIIKKYGISKSILSRIRRGKSWSSVTGIKYSKRVAAIKLILIKLTELDKLIKIAFDDDNDLINKYHIVNSGISDSVFDTLSKIKETSTVYKLSCFRVLYNKTPIGFVVIGDGFLYSFGINIKYRTKDILLKWWDLVKKELKPNFICMMNKKNTRGIEFLKKQGMQVVDDGIEITVLKYT